MICQRGRAKAYLPFILEEKEVEILKKFKYLGFGFTVQHSFSEHLILQAIKAKTKVGFLFSHLNLRNLTLELVLKIFRCYIQPIITYGISGWWGNVSRNALSKVNAVFTQFLKSWLGIPKASSNAMTYFITNPYPLTKQVEWVYSKQFDILRSQLPHLPRVIFEKSSFELDPYWNFEKVPPYMWFNKVWHSIPKTKIIERSFA